MPRFYFRMSGFGLFSKRENSCYCLHVKFSTGPFVCVIDEIQEYIVLLNICYPDTCPFLQFMDTNSTALG